MSFNCDSVALAVLAISIALVKVSDESCSRSFDCTLGLAEPKISASIICSSSFVYLHSLIKTLTFFRNESFTSPGSCLSVLSLYRVSLKLLFGATYSSNFVQYVSSFLRSSSVSESVYEFNALVTSPDQ